jgi:hypothetical protein
MNKIIILLLMLTIFSCQNKETKVDVKETKSSCHKEKKFEMYEMSEMATLMEQMYAYNLQIRARIVKGDTVGKFPEFFNKIYTAKFTTPSDNDAFFKENADKYIAVQKLIYSDFKNEKENFNKGLDACITCHQGKCGGPIPRIKKLYIQ